MYVHPLYHWPPKSRWTQRRSASHRWGRFGAYVHYPFCRNICDFCGYETRLISKREAGRFPASAQDELRHHTEQDDFSSASLSSVFFGGGTASLMSEGTVEALLSTLLMWRRLAGKPEITLECEPGTINRRKLRAMKGAGINRVSVCAQALDNAQLRTISRLHTHEQSLQLVDDCVAVGIDNIHLDLMYGLPGQTQEQWEDTLATAVRLPITHLSAYKLYVFRHGFLHRNEVAPRAEAEASSTTDRLQRMHDTAVEALSKAGFRQYSLTEFARAGYESDYIRSCFRDDILPIGPSAFGRCGRELWEISPYVHLYGDRAASEQYHRAIRLSSAQAFKRDLILGLWLLTVPVNRVAASYGVAPGPALVGKLDEIAAEGRIVFVDGVVSVKELHRFRMGEVMRRLADLDDEEWVVGNVDVVSEEVESGPHEVSNLVNTVIRMARRDPAFFADLVRAPGATLAGLGYDLTNPDIRELLGVIANAKGGAPAGPGLAGVWTAVLREHEEIPKARRERQYPDTGSSTDGPRQLA